MRLPDVMPLVPVDPLCNATFAQIQFAFQISMYAIAYSSGRPQQV